MQGGNRKCKGSEVGTSTAGPGRAEWRAPGLEQGEKTASGDRLPEGGGSASVGPVGQALLDFTPWVMGSSWSSLGKGVI